MDNFESEKNEVREEGMRHRRPRFTRVERTYSSDRFNRENKEEKRGFMPEGFGSGFQNTSSQRPRTQYRPRINNGGNQYGQREQRGGYQPRENGYQPRGGYQVLYQLPWHPQQAYIVQDRTISLKTLHTRSIPS